MRIKINYGGSFIRALMDLFPSIGYFHLYFLSFILNLFFIIVFFNFRLILIFIA